MSWFLELDTEIFRFINVKLAHPWLDFVLPQLAGNRWFIPLAVLASLVALWKGGLRARLFLLVMLVALGIGDGLIINTLKHAFARMRPYHDVLDARVLVGYGSVGSLPSSHTSTWWATALLAFIYYPWTRWFLVPFAALMAFSRVYVGVHY